MIIERKCFDCRGFEHIAYHYGNIGKEGSILMPSNKFEVLKDKVMQGRENSEKEAEKNKRMVLREERLKREKSVEIWKTEVEKKEKDREKKKENC